MLETLIPEFITVLAVESFITVSILVFCANIVTMCLPNKSKNKYIQSFLDIANTISMNIFRNANRLNPRRYRRKSSRKGLAGGDD